MGDHIRKVRLDRHLTQVELAAILQVTGSTINNWERGRHEPDVQSWGKIVSWLGYNPEPEGKTLGERVARRRRELGLTQSALAWQLGVDEGSVQAWEAGDATPNEAHWRRLEAFWKSKEDK